jgi:mono/diheme cytochrome c family protein
MKARLIWTNNGILFLLCLMVLADYGSAQTNVETEKLVLSLPQGNAAAGRRAFQDLLCTSCHLVKGETGFAKPVPGYNAPTLGWKEAKQNASNVAMSILLPSHKISQDLQNRIKSSVSPMTDYSDAITVRQLMDLVAYLRSIK